MTKWLKRIGIAAAVLLVAIQVYQPRRTNPAVDPKQEIHGVVNVQPTVANILNRACNDCHSNRTNWPWYSRVAPASWLVVSDVDRGRAAVNFSNWGGYSPQAQQKHLKEVCSEVTEGEMPALQYTLIHREARLTGDERTAVCRWTKSITESVGETTVSD
jgi:heme-binding protein